MNSAAGFYDSLFVVEFAVVGFLIAGIFLFLQISYQDRLYGFINRAPRGKLILACAPWLISVVVTAIGALFTSFPSHHFYNFNSAGLVLNPWFALLVLILFFGSTIFTVWVAIAEILSLQPSGLIKKASEKITGVDIRRHLIKAYGLREPFHFQVVVRSILNEEDKDTPEDPESKAAHDEEKVLYDRLVRDAQVGRDPLEFIGEVAIRGIRQLDGAPFEHALDAIAAVFEKERDIRVEAVRRGDWNPNSELTDHFISYLLEWVSRLIRECKKENVSKFAQQLYALTGKFASGSLDARNQFQAMKIISFWKLEADRLASNDVAAYGYLVKSIKELGERAFSKQDESFEHQITYEVFGSLGWLVERLMAKQGVEMRPIMHDEAYETPYGILFDALLSFSWEYNQSGARFYPLIFFDAIWVLFDNLLEKMGSEENKEKRRKMYEGLLDCAFTYSQFAESAIIAGNGGGGCLATTRLRKSYDDLARKSDVAEELEKLRVEVIGLMIQVALVATGRDPRSITAEFMTEGIDAYLLKTLSKVPDSYSSSFDKKVFDAVMKTDRHHSLDAVMSFLTELGRARNSTFGLNLPQ